MVGTISNAIKDSEGNTIKDTYLKKSGGSVTGDITLNNKIRLVSKDKKGTEKALIWMNDATNGEIVVALIEDEATVKTFYKEKDHIRLQPENHTMDPIIVPNCQILGKVAGVFRKM